MAELVVEILDYWHVGSSRGSGVAADAVCLRDRHGLPYLPGRQLKGLLRDAVHHCPLVVEHVPDRTRDQVVELLFGTEGFVTVGEAGERQAVETTVRGALGVSDARLPEAIRTYLARDTAGHLRAHLFAAMTQTAVDHDRGAAFAGSLRRTEVAVPLELRAGLEWLDSPEVEEAVPWQALIADALPLVNAIGRHRSRGLGRCRLSLAVGDDKR